MHSGMFYKLWPDDTNKNSAICIKKKVKPFNRHRLNSGHHIGNDEWPHNATFYMSDGLLDDYLIGGMSYFPMSDRLKGAIESLVGDGAQFLPVQIKQGADNPTQKQYWIMNVLQVVDALDWKRTKWVNPQKVLTDPHPVLNIAIPVLEAASLQGISVFNLKIKDDISPQVYVSERVMKSIRNRGVDVGLKLRPISAY